MLFSFADNRSKTFTWVCCGLIVTDGALYILNTKTHSDEVLFNERRQQVVLQHANDDVEISRRDEAVSVLVSLLKSLKSVLFVHVLLVTRQHECCSRTVSSDGECVLTNKSCVNSE